MAQISLSPLTADNWKACAELTIAEAQKSFVPSTIYSIAEAQFYPDSTQLAVYNELEKLVGYCLYGRDIFSGKWKIFRMMIDAEFQGQGYGRAVMVELIRRIRAQQPDADEILLVYKRDNHVAATLYASLGFVALETDNAEHVTACLYLP